MGDYKSSVLQLLAELGGTAPTDIVLSDAEWKAAVLTMLGEIADGGGGGGGGGSSPVLVVAVDGDGKMDKTWQEIHDAKWSVIRTANEVPDEYNTSYHGYVFCTDWYDENDYRVYVAFAAESGGTVNLSMQTYIATSTSGNPVLVGS